MKKIIAISFVALLMLNSGFAVENVILTVSPVVGEMKYPQERMFSFKALNTNPDTIEVSVAPIHLLGAQGSFSSDKVLDGKTVDLTALTSLSPRRFILTTGQMQTIRVFLNSKALRPGDYLFGVNFSILNSKPNNPNQRSFSEIKLKKGSASLSIETYIDQNSTIYVHNGKGRPVVAMGCKIADPQNQQSAMVNISFKNTSVWMLRPEFMATQNGKSIFSKARVAPMMGMTEGTRQLQLPKGTKAPLNVTWTSSEGVSGALTCSAAGA